MGWRLLLLLSVAGALLLASAQWDAYAVDDFVEVNPPASGLSCSDECQRGYDWAIANELNADGLCEGEGDFYRGCLQLVREAQMEQAYYFAPADN